MTHVCRFVSRRHARPKSGRAKTPARLKAVVTGGISVFGGPGDSGVSASEGLALFSKTDLANPKHAALFEIEQPVGTSGMARRLNATSADYIAMRFNYQKTSKEWLRTHTVTLVANGISLPGVRPADWGPAEWTGRIADISPCTAKKLKLKTDDLVTVIVPD